MRTDQPTRLLPAPSDPYQSKRTSRQYCRNKQPDWKQPTQTVSRSGRAGTQTYHAKRPTVNRQAGWSGAGITDQPEHRTDQPTDQPVKAHRRAGNSHNSRSRHKQTQQTRPALQTRLCRLSGVPLRLRRTPPHPKMPCFRPCARASGRVGNTLEHQSIRYYSA